MAFTEGLARFLGKKGPETAADKSKLPKAEVPGAERLFQSPEAEKEESAIVFEAAEATAEKEKGKGEDKTIVFNDGKRQIYAVLDGIGGQEMGGGDVAAQIVKEAFLAEMAKIDDLPKDEGAIKEVLTEVVLKADEELRNNPTAAIYEKMGTTLTAMVSHGDKMSVVSVGDSKAYRLRGGKLEQLSFEDSVPYILKKNGYDIDMDLDKLSRTMPDGTEHDVTLNEVVSALGRPEPSGYATEETSKEGEQVVKDLLKVFGDTTLKSLRNVNTGGIAAGEKKTPQVHVRTFDVRDGDEYFVTSDGLTDNCSDKNLEWGLNKMAGKSPDAKARELLNYGKKRQDRTQFPNANKPDDISIVYFRANKKDEEAIGEEDIEILGEVGT